MTAWSVAARPVVLLAICFVTATACGGTPSSPSGIPISQLLSAPTRIVAGGTSLTLSSFLWRDFMPPAPADGRPLQGVLRVSAVDGSPVGAVVRVDSCWVIYGGDVWTATVERQPPVDNARHHEAIVRNGPKWGPDVEVDVVVRLSDATGMFLLRAANQKIGATF